MLTSISIFASFAYGDEQARGIEGLAEETAGALGAALICDFVTASNQEYRQFRTQLFQLITKFKARAVAGRPRFARSRSS